MKKLSFVVNINTSSLSLKTVYSCYISNQQQVACKTTILWFVSQ